MKTYSRREFLRLAGLAIAGVSLTGCANGQSQIIARALPGPSLSTALANPMGLPSTDFRALNRLCYGPTANERAFVRAHGIPAWIETQLAHTGINDDSTQWRLSSVDSLTLSANEIQDSYADLFDGADKEAAIGELRQATLIRQIYSERQLYEMMVEFWSDHFNIDAGKGDCWFLKMVDDREVIRPHALGRFRDLLWASAHSPAMLVYLDNQANRAGTPNENYARELLELHTLGVHGGYQQQDVQALARCLTGWTVKSGFVRWPGEFIFDEAQHDVQVKTVLGMTLQPDGINEAEHVIDQLATHPSTAQFIATKLARRFIADDPPAHVIGRTAQAFTRSQGDIRVTLKALLLEGNGLAALQPKLKRPSQYMVSALRMLGGQSDGGAGVQTVLRRMGQPLFGWPTPDGYPDRAEAWQHNLLPRWQFALALTHDQIDGTWINNEALETVATLINSQRIDSLYQWLFGESLPERMRESLRAIATDAIAEPSATARTTLAALLCAPNFQWR